MSVSFAPDILTDEQLAEVDRGAVPTLSTDERKRLRLAARELLTEATVRLRAADRLYLADAPYGAPLVRRWRLFRDEVVALIVRVNDLAVRGTGSAVDLWRDVERLRADADDWGRAA